MSRLQYFSLRRLNGRIFWAFVGLAILMLATGIGTNLSLGAADSSNQQQLLRVRQVETAKTLQSNVSQQIDTLELFLDKNISNTQRYLEANRKRTLVLLTEATPNFPNGDEARPHFDKINAAYNALGLRLFQNQGKLGNLTEEREVYQSLRADFDLLAQDTDIFTRERVASASAATSAYLNQIETARITYLIISFLLFLLAVILAWLIAQMVARPLAMLAGRLRRIAAGDLTEALPPKGADEVVELSLIFNRTIANLKLAISRIQQQVGTISQTSRQIGLSSDNQANSLSEQAVAVSQVSATVAELSDTSQHIAGSASLVAESANNALESATIGYDTLHGASETMSEIRHKVNLIADRILALNSVAQRIREVTLLIDTLSNETHLLALNAAIESAGAGEEGARFAVVAGHVRKLSQRSRVAAVEIQGLVSQIQHAAASSVMATEEGIKVVALGDKMVLDSLQANEEIIKQVGQTTQLAQAISQATEQQRVASNQAAETMRQLSGISSNISLNSQQYLISASDLENVVNGLNAVVNAFIIQEKRGGAVKSNPAAASELTRLPAIKTEPTSLKPPARLV